MANDENDIDVTPEMIEAGMEKFLAFDRRFDDEEKAVASIYKAMELRRRSNRAGSPARGHLSASGSIKI